MGPYFILVLDSGPATTFGLGFVWPPFPLATPSALLVLTGPSIENSNDRSCVGLELSVMGVRSPPVIFDSASEPLT
jgi:hypothetical protein